MALFPLGILSAAGAGGAVTPTYELIQTQILGSNQSSVVFSNLGDFSASYRHLQLRWTARATRTDADNEGFVMRFNGDTGTNYATHSLGAIGSSFTGDWNGANTTFVSFGYVAATNFSSSGIFSAGVIDILDAYSTTKNKTTRSLAGNLTSNRNFIHLTSGHWRNTSATSSLTLFTTDGGSLVTGSRFSIYGIRG